MSDPAQPSTVPSPAPSRSAELAILIVAPTGRDAAYSAEFLERAGLRPVICPDIPALSLEMERGCGAILMAEEAMSGALVSEFLDALVRQPSWSDIPIVLITSSGDDRQTRSRSLQVFGPASTVMLIERPFRPDTLIAAMKVALRSRQRQYQVRDLLAERAQVAQELQRLVAERTAALQDTVAQLESFSYSVTHDMRGPLRAIASYAQLLRNEFSEPLPEEARDYLRRISESSVRLDRLIQDVLQYSRLGRDEIPLEVVDVGKLLGTLIHEYPSLHEFKGHISIDCLIPPVLANTAALSQCLANLLNNAVKFVPTGMLPQIHVLCEEQPEYVRITVKDNGIGIAHRHHEQIFGAFKRLHHAHEYEGTGIGLAIVKRAAERMKGRVGVDSTPGQGSRFWIELPRADVGTNRP